MSDTCADCGEPIDTSGAFFVSVHSDTVELHGVIADFDTTRAFASAMKPFGLVKASPMPSHDHRHGGADDHQG